MGDVEGSVSDWWDRGEWVQGYECSTAAQSAVPAKVLEADGSPFSADQVLQTGRKSLCSLSSNWPGHGKGWDIIC